MYSKPIPGNELWKKFDDNLVTCIALTLAIGGLFFL
jgi:hypothetical protein